MARGLEWYFPTGEFGLASWVVPGYYQGSLERVHPLRCILKMFVRVKGLFFMKYIRTTLLFLLVAGFMFGAASVVAQDDNTLVITSNSDVNSLDPAVGYDTVSWPSESLVYRGLVTYADDGMTLEPALAESYKVSDDGLTYTFTLRSGVKFSNGREITADDVKYSFERLLNPKTASPGTFMFDVIAGAQDYIANKAAEVSGIKVVDPRTVQFTLSRPEWTFLQRMAVPFASIVAKEGVEAAGDQFGRKPLGAGPFVLTSWDAGLSLKFDRNPNYYRDGYPKVDHVEIQVGQDPAAAVLKIESGDADTSLDFVPQSDYPRIAQDAALKDRLILSPVPNVFYIAYNVREKPFDDVRVRKALSMAIDRDRIVQVLNGRPQPADGLFPPNLQGNNPNLQPEKFDPEGAKALLKDAGYADGLSTSLYVDTDPQDVSVVQAIVQDWEQIGVKTDIVQLEFSQLLDIMYGSNPGQMPLLYISWYADYPDPSDFYEPLLKCGSGNNTGGFCDEKLDKIEADAALIPPGDARWKAFAGLEAAINDDMPWAFVFYGRNFFYTSGRVKGLKPHPSYGLTFETATVQ
jgi:ABC-type transport system substrate-binding protein